MDLLADLDARGLIHDSTDRERLAARLASGPITLYHGIDPSADSLHTGNLIGLMMLRRFQLAGHRPIALAGGATGMIGDPGGRSEERNLLDEDTLRANVAAIKAQIARVLGDEGEWQLVDNYEWTRDVPLLAFLRDVGKHVTVNQMMARESVRARLESEHGISFTEFSYMLLQANDYWWLHEHEGCELQIGGSDQWGNILSGVDLIRRRSGVAVHALCWPLLTAADGTKLGKTTGARIWLDPDRTSPFELFQHFVQTDDRQVRQLLLWLTLLPVEEIDEVVRRHEQAPQHREAQRLLAREVVTLVHGPDAAAGAEKGTSAWSAEFAGSAPLARDHACRRPSCRPGSFPWGSWTCSCAPSWRPRRAPPHAWCARAGPTPTTSKIEDEDRIIDADDFIEGRWLLLRAGKRQQHLVLRASSG